MRPNGALRAAAFLLIVTSLAAACTNGATAGSPPPTTRTPTASDASTPPTSTASPAPTATTTSSATPGRRAAPSTNGPAPSTGAPIPGANALITSSGPSADGGSYDLSGLVLGVIENGGTCTFTLTRGVTAVHRAQRGLADANDTSCGTVSVPRADLAAGSWTVTLTYAGQAGAATSTPTQMVVK